MGRWVTSKGRRVYIPDEGEKNPFSKDGPQANITRKDVEELTARKDALKGVKLDAKPITQEEIQFTSNGTYNFKGESAPKDLPRVTDEQARHNQMVRFRGTDYQTQQVVDWDNEKKKDYVAGHLYIPHNALGKGSFFVAKDNTMWHSGTDYLIGKKKRK